jgi:hypothetical protein
VLRIAAIGVVSRRAGWESAHVPSERDHAPEPARSAPEPAAAGPPTRLGRIESAADVLALQRRIGNAATRRWLARQATEADTAWTDICATAVPAPAGAPPQAIAADEPLIHTVAGPCLTHWAGGYHWFVRYQLPHPAPTRGHIIQELHQQGSGGSSEHFWEYWEVAAGAREPADRTNTPSWITPPGLPYDDRYVHGIVPGSAQALQGWYRHVGVVRFYPGALPPQFTGDNRQTRVMPDGWTGAGARHDCYAEWDRRPGQPRRLGLLAFAGTQAYRAGDAVRAAGP